MLENPVSSKCVCNLSVQKDQCWLWNTRFQNFKLKKLKKNALKLRITYFLRPVKVAYLMLMVIFSKERLPGCYSLIRNRNVQQKGSERREMTKNRDYAYSFCCSVRRFKAALCISQLRRVVLVQSISYSLAAGTRCIGE